MNTIKPITLSVDSPAYAALICVALPRVKDGTSIATFVKEYTQAYQTAQEELGKADAMLSAASDDKAKKVASDRVDSARETVAAFPVNPAELDDYADNVRRIVWNGSDVYLLSESAYTTLMFNREEFQTRLETVQTETLRNRATAKTLHRELVEKAGEYTNSLRFTDEGTPILNHDGYQLHVYDVTEITSSRPLFVPDYREKEVNGKLIEIDLTQAERDAKAYQKFIREVERMEKKQKTTGGYCLTHNGELLFTPFVRVVNAA